MPRTRSTKAAKSSPKEETPNPISTTARALPPSDTNPPKLFILPAHTSPNARIITLSNPATGTPSRYLFSPEKLQFYEFTRISAPKKACKSWLITSDVQNGERDGGLGNGYITRSPDLFVTTPIDTLFLLLPCLAPSNTKTQDLFLSFDDHLDVLVENNAHLRPLLRQHPELKTKMEKRISAVCDTVDAGDEQMYKLNPSKLLSILLRKAKKMCESGVWPASMEDKFIRGPLDVPVMSIKREDTNISIIPETALPETAVAKAEDGENPEVVGVESQTSTTTTVTESQTTTMESQSTTATTPDEEPAEALKTPPEIPRLLRLRTAINYLLSAYVPSSLHTSLHTLLTTQPLFTPLTTHLAALSALKKEAAALRSISDNITRKRPFEEDEDKIAEREEKKRKKEEEEKRKKSESVGVRRLKKVDTSGMKKLSSFFTKAPAKGKK
jgi:hypothetical protein